MKKSVFIFSFFCVVQLNSQTIAFDSINANPSVNKSITWNTSSLGEGFGHRIVNTNSQYGTLLNFQGRHDTVKWSDILTLSSLGRVGINTSTPRDIFQIGEGFLFHDGKNKVLSLSEASFNTDYYASEIRFDQFKGSLFLNTSRTNKDEPSHTFEITKEGKIGIGTKGSPTEKLQIGNAFSFHDGGHKVLGISYLPTAGAKQLPDQYGAEIRFDSHTGLLTIGSSNVKAQQPISRITFTKDGLVGIGTSNPDAQLTVKGKIHATDVKVDVSKSKVPDYVFLEDYDLKSLEDVEKFIVKEGHLPNVPSATEMETNGIDLKEMNLKLLEKIEELTLYLVQQDKRLKALENDNSDLKSQIRKK